MKTEQPPAVIVDLEWTDGSCQRLGAESRDDARALIDYYERRTDLKSAWIDEEPAHGDCTRMDIP